MGLENINKGGIMKLQKGVFTLITLLIGFAQIYCVNIVGNYQYSNFFVNQMPLSIRNVPNHPDDGQNDAGPIAREKYSTESSINLGLEWQKETEFDDLFIKFRTLLIIVPGDMAERNYTNAVGTDKRGYGAALTYCRLHSGGIIARFGVGSIYIDIEPQIGLERFISEHTSISLLVGYRCISASTGWDRYDRLESRKNYLLADCIPTSLILGHPIGNFAIHYGIVMSNPIRTSIGKEILGYKNPGYILELSYNFNRPY